MSTEYPVIETDTFTIDTGCKGELYVNFPKEFITYEAGPFTEDEFVEMAAKLLGPRFYYTDSKDLLIDKFADYLDKHGYTYRLKRRLDASKAVE